MIILDDGESLLGYLKAFHLHPRASYLIRVRSDDG